jgi:hypothetical protein
VGKEEITRENRDVGQVDANDVLWIFFGGEAARYDHTQPQALHDAAEAAYQKWGGGARLKECLKIVPQS